jgi:hypothetical protein
MGTGAAIPGKVLTQEDGEVGAEEGHDGSPRCSASPALAMPAISAGVACKYQ